MQAVLFDLDGTLVHSDPVHAAVFADLLGRHGVTIDMDDYLERFHGRHNADIFADLLPGHDAAALSDTKEAMFRDRLDMLSPVAGLPGLLRRLRRDGIAIGVVTNAPRANAEAVLDALTLTDTFDTLVIGDECPRGKPDPAPYQGALDRLGIAPGNAIAVEDSPSGIASAVAAGIFTFGIRTSLSHDALIAAGAKATIADFNDTALHAKLDRLTGAAP